MDDAASFISVMAQIIRRLDEYVRINAKLRQPLPATGTPCVKIDVASWILGEQRKTQNEGVRRDRFDNFHSIRIAKLFNLTQNRCTWSYDTT